MSNPWIARIDALLAALNEHPLTAVSVCERGAPLSDEDLATVEARLGYALDPAFVDFFRAADGLKVCWTTTYLDGDYAAQREEGFPCGGINIPSLLELFPAKKDHLFGWDSVSPGENQLPILGGWDERALREALRDIDNYTFIVDEMPFKRIALVADARYPSPVLLMTDDYTAAIADHRPMKAVDYLDLVVATLGAEAPRLACLRARGYAADHAMFEPAPGWLDSIPAPDAVIKYHHDELSLEEFNRIDEALRAIGR